MPVKKKPTAKQLAARKKFVEMVRAKAKAKKIASTHKDTKSHNVNVKVVSGTKVKSTTRQTGSSNIEKDFLKKAKVPGKRKSASGRTYYERRANRSDKPGSLLGIKGLKKISGVLPHKAKYYIDYMLHGIERTEYFDKLPKGKYRAENNIYYILKLTDAGTSLIPILNVKTNQPIKKIK